MKTDWRYTLQIMHGHGLYTQPIAALDNAIWGEIRAALHGLRDELQDIRGLESWVIRRSRL